MPQNNGRMKRSEKGLLTPDNCVVAFIDHQPQMLFGTSNFDRQSIINTTVALAKATRIFDVPVVLSTVETKSFSGNMWPQLKAIFPDQTPIERSSMNSWDDKNFVAAIERTGKKKIVLSGLWTETCVALPTIQAIHDGYEIYVAEDCCGDVSQLAHDNAMRRVVQAGAKPVTALSVLLEWQRDWAHKDTYDAVMDVVKHHFGAYGIGVEYVYTMVHGAPPTQISRVRPAGRGTSAGKRGGDLVSQQTCRSHSSTTAGLPHRMTGAQSYRQPRFRTANLSPSGQTPRSWPTVARIPNSSISTNGP